MKELGVWRDMGRKTYPYRGPRTTLVADREVERAVRVSGTPSFGVRRQILEPWADKILGITLEMQANGELPDESKVRICDDLGVTMLGQRVLLSRLQRGAIGLEQVNRVRSNLAKAPTRRDIIPIRLGEISVIKDRIICADIEAENDEGEDELIGAESKAIHAGLVMAGLKGVKRVQDHLTLAVALNGKAISQDDQEAAMGLLQLRLPTEIEAAPWRTYPDTDVFGD